MTSPTLLPRINTPYAILAIGWLLGVWLAFNMSHRAEQRRVELETAQQQVQKFQALAALKPRIAAQYQAYAAAFQEGEQQPGSQSLMGQLEGCADDGMQLNLKPQARSQPKDADSKQVSVEVELEATQQGVMAFLDRVFALPSLIEVEKFQMAGSASTDRPLRATLLVSRHEL